MIFKSILNKHYYVLSILALSIATVTDLFDYLDRLSLKNLKTAKIGICTPLKIGHILLICLRSNRHRANHISEPPAKSCENL